jgi:hypothetical protein
MSSAKTTGVRLQPVSTGAKGHSTLRRNYDIFAILAIEVNNKWCKFSRFSINVLLCYEVFITLFVKCLKFGFPFNETT